MIRQLVIAAEDEMACCELQQACLPGMGEYGDMKIESSSSRDGDWMPVEHSVDGDESLVLLDLDTVPSGGMVRRWW